jgi:lipopolysaccharide biosynthesis protein
MISKGQSSYDTKLYAIFVYNIDGRIPGYMRSWIDALNRQKINIWIITNKTLAEKTRAELLNVCDLFVERHNIGRDFGAYKDGISLLKSRQIDAENLLLSNDSVFYCGKDLQGTITALLAGRELSGLCESFDNGYHVQSYLLGIGPDLLHNGVFWDYWKKYLPISTRNWAIKKGEIGFSRVMVKNGVSANSIFYPKIILDVINGETYDNLINMLYFIANWSA